MFLERQRMEPERKKHLEYPDQDDFLFQLFDSVSITVLI